MSKFTKDFIDDIKKKFPSLQRKPKTAEQRKEQDKITKHKRYTQAPQFRAKKNQELIEKRSKGCPLERQRRLNKQKEYHSQKRSAESQIEKQRRLTQDKEYHS